MPPALSHSDPDRAAAISQVSMPAVSAINLPGLVFLPLLPVGAAIAAAKHLQGKLSLVRIIPSYHFLAIALSVAQQ